MDSTPPHTNDTFASDNTLVFDAIGTTWQIAIANTDKTLRSKLANIIASRIELFDQQYSRFREDSLVHRMSQKAGKYHLPKDAKTLLDFYEKLYTVTAGKVTPLIGSTLVQAGYDAAYSLAPAAIVSSPPSWQETLDYQWPYLRLQSPAILDFGAAGKGYLVDLIGALLRAEGVSAATINAGGDILHFSGGDTLDVALENPNDTTEAIGVATIHNQAICGSAGNRRAWATYHHIIDPSTVQSPQKIKAVWVVAATAMLADGLSTALFFCAPQLLAEHFSFEYALVLADNSLQYSARFPASFFAA